MNGNDRRNHTETLDLTGVSDINILDTTATPLRRASMTGKQDRLSNGSLAFGKKKKSSQANSGEKEVRYNFKGQDRFVNATKCFICEKKFGMGTKRHHW